MAIPKQQVVPALRITHYARSKAFYIDGLGFGVAWEHRFEPHFPVFISISLDGMEIFLSEHSGDCQVGGLVHFYVPDVDARYDKFRKKARRTKSLRVAVVSPWNSSRRSCHEHRYSSNRRDRPSSPRGLDSGPGDRRYTPIPGSIPFGVRRLHGRARRVAQQSLPERNRVRDQSQSAKDAPNQAIASHARYNADPCLIVAFRRCSDRSVGQHGAFFCSIFRFDSSDEFEKVK